MAHDTTEPSKPGGETDDRGVSRDVGDRQAVRNQGEAKPSDYPAHDRAAGEEVEE